MFVQELSKRLLRGISYALEQEVQRVLGGTNGTHAVVDAARPTDRV